MANSMSLSDFSMLVGAAPRWCQNALLALDLGFRYERYLAQSLGLARLLQQGYGMPLRRAMATAEAALKLSPPARVRLAASDGVTALELDVPRYLSRFALRAARLSSDAPPRPGRPKRANRGGGIAAGAAYGLDIGALRSGLRASPAERLERLDANQRLIAALRAGRTPT